YGKLITFGPSTSHRRPPPFRRRPHITAATCQEEPPMPRITHFLVSALAVLVVLVGTFGVAAAEQTGPTVTPPHTNYGELEQLYRLRQSQVRSLYEMLSRDEQRALEVDKLIAYAKSKGVD